MSRNGRGSEMYAYLYPYIPSRVKTWYFRRLDRLAQHELLLDEIRTYRGEREYEACKEIDREERVTTMLGYVVLGSALAAVIISRWAGLWPDLTEFWRLVW